MKTIDKEYSITQIINKSTFIAYLNVVNSVKEANIYIDNIKKIHPNATHNCSAFIINDHQIYKKSDDDGEPSKTAGYPILNVLEKNNLVSVVCVITRYYGGIKLGAGGLVRAYSSSTVKVLETAILYDLIKSFKIKIKVSYELSNSIIYYLENNCEIIKKEYLDYVYITFISITNILDQIKTITNNNFEVIEINDSFSKIIS